MQLTKANYFSKNNFYLSNSKMNDWLRCPEYFYRKHVTHEIEELPTDAMILGSAIDTAVTDSWEAFVKQYRVVSRRDKKADDYRYQLNQTQYDDVARMYEKVTEQAIYEPLMKHRKQVLLYKDMEIGEHFVGVCGVLDFLQVREGTATITDLKTTKSMDSNKYYWACVNYGYFRQMAMYDLLVRMNYPKVSNVVHRHLAIEKDTNNIFRVKTYMMSEERIQEEMQNIDNTIQAIGREKKFKAPQVSWDDAIRI